MQNQLSARAKKRQAMRKAEATGGLPPLTDRETEIVRLIWAGFSNAEIGTRLAISTKTVEAHRANMMKKYRACNTAQLLRQALTERVIFI